MTKKTTTATPTAKGKATKKAIVPRGKYEAEILKPRWDNEVRIRELADALLKEYAESQALWLQDFFIKRLITRKQIMNMRNRSEYFAEVYSLAKDIQESRLVRAGLTGQGNIQQVIFALKNVSKWRSEPLEDTNNRAYNVIGFKYEVYQNDGGQNDN